MIVEASRPRAAAVLAELLEPRRLLAAALPSTKVAVSQPDASLAGIVADPARDHVFVGDAGDHTILVIDTQTARQIASIPVAAEPMSLAITPDGGSLIVALPYAHQVQVISTSTLTSVRTVNVGVPLVDVAGGVGGKFYGVTSTDEALADTTQYYGSQGVAQFDLTTGARGPSLASPTDTNLYLRADSAGQRIYVASRDDGELFNVFDVTATASPSLVDQIYEENVRYVDVFDDRVSGRRYIADGGSGDIEVHRADGSESTWSIPPENGEDTSPAWAEGSLCGIDGTPGGAYVFATYCEDGWTSGTLVAFDAATGVVRQTYTLPKTNATSNVVVTPDGRAAFISDIQTLDQDGTEDVYGVGLVGSGTLQLGAATVSVVTGTIFSDANRNGVQDAGEGDWATLKDDDLFDADDVIVYADLNNNGKLDADDPESNVQGDEPHQVLNTSGQYTLDLPLAGGTYAIRLIANPTDDVGHIALFNSGPAERTVTLSKGQQLGDVNFGVIGGVTVEGHIFADFNGNGKQDDDEPSISGSQAYLDRNSDGQHESTEPIGEMTEDDGSNYDYGAFYAFDALPGAGVVRLLNTPGYELTTPPSGSIAGGIGTTDEVDFGIRPQLAVTGTLYDDANANGTRDASEPPLVGARVWLDVDGNGKFTKGEPTGLTTATGQFAIAAKERGTSAVTLLARDASAHPFAIAQKAHNVRFTDWKQTIAGTLGAYAPATLSITAFVDRDENHKHNRGDAWLAYTIAYLDLDNDGKQDKNEPSVITDAVGHATFTALLPGTYVVRLRVSSKLKAKTVPTLKTTLAAGDTRAWSAAIRA